MDSHGIPAVLIDTNIVIYLLHGDSRAQACAPYLEGKIVAISFQSVGELWYGAIRNEWGDRKLRRIDDRVQKMTVLTVDEATVRIWADLRAASESRGLTKSIADLWIAATAKRHDLPLVTNDRGFLTALDIEVLSPDLGQ
ncbi:MAG: PIN domain-containing protein [Actinomycetota bacterium]